MINHTLNFTKMKYSSAILICYRKYVPARAGSDFRGDCTSTALPLHFCRWRHYTEEGQYHQRLLKRIFILIFFSIISISSRTLPSKYVINVFDRRVSKFVYGAHVWKHALLWVTKNVWYWQRSAHNLKIQFIIYLIS